MYIINENISQEISISSKNQDQYCNELIILEMDYEKNVKNTNTKTFYYKYKKPNELWNVILRLRPHDLPRISLTDDQTDVFHKIVITLFSLLSLNMIGIITIMVYYLTQIIKNEMNIIPSKEITLTLSALCITLILKIFQWILNYNNTDINCCKNNKNDDICKRNIILNIPCLIILWLSMTYVGNYKFKITTSSLYNRYNLNYAFEKYQNLEKYNLFEDENNQYTFSFYNNRKYHYNEEIIKSWDEIHLKYKCCGLNGIDNFHEWNIPPPESCKIIKENYNIVRGCQPFIIDTLYDASTQIYCVLFWLLIPIESIFAILSVIIHYGKFIQLKNSHYTDSKTLNKQQILTFYTYYFPTLY